MTKPKTPISIEKINQVLQTLTIAERHSIFKSASVFVDKFMNLITTTGVSGVTDDDRAAVLVCLHMAALSGTALAVSEIAIDVFATPDLHSVFDDLSFSIYKEVLDKDDELKRDREDAERWSREAKAKTNLDGLVGLIHSSADPKSTEFGEKLSQLFGVKGEA